MKNFFARNWKALLIIAIFGLVGGFFTGLMSFDSLAPEVQEQVFAQGMNRTTLSIVTAIQVAIFYGVLLGIAGIFFAEKIGLWKNEWSITKKPLIAAVIVSVVGGLALILFDVFIFGNYSDVIKNSFSAKPTIPYLVSCVTYGAVIEEVMLRLFVMSLFAFIFHKLFENKKETVSSWVLVTANIVAAVLFAAGHLPTTFSTIGNSSVIIFRCFLLNGGIGLLFGYLYRKYGLRYSMIAHGGCHVVSKLIWILFL